MGQRKSVIIKLRQKNVHRFNIIIMSVIMQAKRGSSGSAEQKINSISQAHTHKDTNAVRRGREAYRL